MFNIRQRRYFEQATVLDLWEALGKLPPDMAVFFNGNAEGYLHVNTKGNFCCIDESDLAESYGEQEEALQNLMNAVAEFGLASAWTDNDIIEALTQLGVTRADFERHGKGDFVKSYYDEK